MPSRDAGSTSLSAAPSCLLMEAPPAAAVPPAFGMAVRSEPSSVAVARRVTKAWIRCHCRMSADQVDAFLIVVSELCTNAVQHGRHGSIHLRCWMTARDELRLEVHDRTPSTVPEPRCVRPESENGRGLLLVEALVTEMGGTWGFGEDGSFAWCSLVLSGEGR